MRISGFLHFTLLASISCGTMALYQCATAQTAPTTRFDQPAKPMAESLKQAAATARMEIIFLPADVESLAAPALHGDFDAQTAIGRLISGTGLTVQISDGTIFIRGRPQPSGEADDRPTASNAIIVTGTRIANAPASSTVVQLSAKGIADQGHHDLGEAIRALPQNFGGGQNPGVALGATGSDNINLTGGSSINLRGLGQDATLTLLNGRRLSYGSASQAVDVSSIPLAAVERVDVLLDGASAIYGSDAVAGVVNIVLRRDVDGLSTSARIGTSTDGGFTQQQYDLVGGQRWSTGGFIAAYSYDRNSQIAAGQRSYTSGLDGSTTLYPYQSHHAGLLSAHQKLGDDIELALDALYSRRASDTQFPFTTSADYKSLGFSQPSTAEQFTIAPSVTASLSPDWALSLQLVYGEDRTRYHSLQWADGSVYADLSGCYCNSAISAEGTIEGSLFTLPGGEAKIVLGGGYRSNRMGYERALTYTGEGVPAQQWAFNVSRDNYFGFGEVQLPLVSPDQHMRFAHRLSLNSALRYERYPGMASVATPKLGLVYAPVADVTLKASWGKSFKAPTLYQQYVTQNAWLYAASGYGSGLSPSASVIFLGGGNADLEPERATSWSASAVLTPSALPGVSIEAGYFHIRYRNRVVAPILSSAGVLDNPVYASLVTPGPGAAQIADAIAYGGGLLQNYSGSAYDPSNVVAIIDNRNRNVAQQTISGIDAAASYSISVGESSKITLSLAGTYLDSSQLLLPGAAATDMAGQIFNPPHFRGRAGATWDGANTSLSTWVNRIGGVEDGRRADARHVRGMTTVDVTARIATGIASGPFGNVEFTLTASNLFDAKPDLIRTDYDYYAPYDSTNYSPIGRVLSLSVRKKW